MIAAEAVAHQVMNAATGGNERAIRLVLALVDSQGEEQRNLLLSYLPGHLRAAGAAMEQGDLANFAARAFCKELDHELSTRRNA